MDRLEILTGVLLSNLFTANSDKSVMGIDPICSQTLRWCVLLHWTKSETVSNPPKSRFLIGPHDICFAPVVTCFNLPHVTTVQKTSNKLITGHCYKLTQCIEALHTTHRHWHGRTYPKGLSLKLTFLVRYNCTTHGCTQYIFPIVYHNNIFVSFSSTSAFISTACNTSRCSPTCTVNRGQPSTCLPVSVLVHQHQRPTLTHTTTHRRPLFDCLSDPKVLP